MKATHKYRTLNIADLIRASQKKHIFRACKGHFFALRNTNQVVIITDTTRAYLIKRKAPKRNAKVEAEYQSKNKVFLLLNCQNIASIKAYCKRHEIKAPKKIKLLLGIDDILLDKQKR